METNYSEVRSMIFFFPFLSPKEKLSKKLNNIEIGMKAITERIENEKTVNDERWEKNDESLERLENKDKLQEKYIQNLVYNCFCN
jgi:predicted ribosome quality control (RQC) complex YloA/Tae2 family protein